MDKLVGHSILTPGKVIKSPSGDLEWVVIERLDDDTIRIASIHKYMNKSEKELMNWSIAKK